jgi:hypothetical protein
MELYKNNNDFVKFIKSFCALAFVPLQDVSRAYESLAGRFHEYFNNEQCEVVKK